MNSSNDYVGLSANQGRVLNEKITAESSAREKADTNLQKLIEQEKTDREAKDKALQEAIDNVSASNSTITVDETAELIVVN